MVLLTILSCGADAPEEAQGRLFRLNHRQWESTVVDLLGLTDSTELSQDFVPDPAASTFDTNLTTLSVSPTLWQQYRYAAEVLAERAVTEEDLYAVVVPEDLRPQYSVYTTTQRDAWIAHFGRRVWRRSLTTMEVDELAVLFDDGQNAFFSGDPFVDGVRAVITVTLQSPAFLYRTEGVEGEDGELSQGELASKLSYSLWGSMPDEALLAAAEADALTGSGLVEQVERMLDDPRGQAIVSDIHRQLLHVDSYAQIWRPDDEVLGIGTFAASLPAMMQQEVYAFVGDVVYSDGTLRDLLTSPTTFVNADLAEVYGFENLRNEEELVALSLDPDERAGLLTLSGFLAWQADSSKPNLIERGAFINDALLCADVPPAPSNASPLPTDTEDLSLRELIQAHTSSCGGSCHNDLINPIGFAFGAYDENGVYVPLEENARRDIVEPVNVTGSYTFTDGVFSFDGAVELAAIMAEREQVHRCYVEHLYSYLGGMPTDSLDEDLLDRLTADSMGDRAIRSLIIDIVTDEDFRKL